MLAAVVNTDFQRHQIIQAGIQAFDQLTMVLGLIGQVQQFIRIVFNVVKLKIIAGDQRVQVGRRMVLARRKVTGELVATIVDAAKQRAKPCQRCASPTR